MTLAAFTFTMLGVSVVVLVMGGLIEWLNQRRVSDGKRIRDLYAENCRLRAKLRGRDFEHEWTLDEVKTELAVKELLLRQKWEAAKK